MLIAHTTDLSGDDMAAFVHASAFAAATNAPLITVYGHLGRSNEQPSPLPDASELAARWGRPIAHERRSLETPSDATEIVSDALRELQPHLVVLGTHARHGFGAFLHESVAEAIARRVNVPALVVPNHVRGFVDQRTGALELRRIVIPAGNAADATSALVAVRRLLVAAGITDAELELVHVGDDDPPLAHPDLRVTRARGARVEAIVETARARQASLIVMATHGHDGLVDLVQGSHTERVIRAADCPVLSVPDAA